MSNPSVQDKLATKKVYQKPTLRNYGDMPSMTASTGMGSMFDGMSVNRTH